ncbi:MAG: Matrixin [Pseudomonadota bacterium]|jgi:hypothetical protein
MLRNVLLSLFSLQLCGCKLPTSSTDSQPAFVTGDWWAQPAANLLVAVHQGRPLLICMESEGSVDSVRYEKDAGQFASVVKFAILEWMRVIQVNPEVRFLLGTCGGDVSAGELRVILHYDEGRFQREISQTTSPTLGAYLIGAGSLYLNMAGVTNPKRDSSGGRKTVLHELGHAFGLHHSNVSGAVMQANLRNAANSLTTDDARGIAEIWYRIRRIQPRGDEEPQPEVGKTPRGSEGVVWSEPPPEGSAVSIKLRHDSWFKTSTAQSAELSAQQKCSLVTGQAMKVFILNGGRGESGHFRVRLAEPLSGCEFAKVGQTGFVFQAHVD